MTTRTRALRRTAALVTALIAGVAVAMQACGPGAIDDLTRGRPDAGVAADVDAGALDSAVCTHASAPERPTSADGPSIPGLTFAFDDIRFDTGLDPAALPTPYGLDLDKTCTCPEPPSCKPRSDAAAEACDFDGGRDNVTGQLLTTLLTVTTRGDGGPRAVIREQILRGFFTALVQIQEWNGQPNDPHVLASVVLSTGSEDDGDGGRIVPKLDGTDVWKVDPGSLTNGDDIVGKDCRAIPCVSLTFDANAYVVDGTLVSRLERASIRVRTESGPLTIDFVDSTLMAKIIRVGGSYRLQGEIAGRWPTDRLLAGLAGVRDPTTKKSLCPPANAVTYDLIKRAVCESADLANEPARDRTGETCNALSDALAFSAVPATLGKVENLVQDPPDCPGFTDSCDKK